MQTKTKIAVAITAATGLFAAYQFVAFAGSTIALQERFPDIDPDVVYEVHKIMWKKAITGKLNDFDTSDDATMDQLFLLEVDRFTSN